MIAVALIIVAVGSAIQGSWWLAGICAIGALISAFLDWVWS